MATSQQFRETMARRASPAIPKSRVDNLPVYLAVALIYISLLPPQFIVNIGGLAFPPYRFFLIPAFLYLVRGTLRGRLQFAWPDAFIVMAVFWIWLASYVVSGSIQTMFVQGGAHLIDIGLAYFVARFAIRSPNDFRILLILIAPGVFIMGAVVFAEAVTGRYLIQPFASMLTGFPNPLRLDSRMGLLRGSASFPHPILAGIILASFLTLYAMSGLRGWPKFIGILAAVMSFFTMSSAALLGLVVGAALLIYDWLAVRIANLNWRVFLAFAAIIYFVTELGTKSGFFNLLVRFASFNSVSAYNRVLIWEFGTKNVANNPWFGIGYDDWVRPIWMSRSGSFDHFWLLTAVRFGIPATVFMIAATVVALLMLMRHSQKLPPVDARLLRGVAICLAVYALGAVSVALWLVALLWLTMLIGFSVSLASTPVAKPHPRALRQPRW